MRLTGTRPASSSSPDYPALSGRMRGVTNSDCQGIAGIFGRRGIGFAGGFKAQQRPHHKLDLAFFSAAVTYHAAFHLERRVFPELEPRFGDGQERDAAHV